MENKLFVNRLTASPLILKNMVIAIGASTGGTETTLKILRQLPADMPGIVVTQHMPEGFTAMYASRLDQLCAMRVKEARDGDVIEQGQVLLAPGGECHMSVVKEGHQYKVRCLHGEKVNGHRPSVDVLFRSVAETVGRSAVGVILTGMGADGAAGLLQMRKKGAYTIGQDKESSIVYGMPMEAQRIGACSIQASCNDIAYLLVKYINQHHLVGAEDHSNKF